MTGKRKTLWVVAAALAALMVWVAAPVDLVPNWLALGSDDRSEQLGLPHIVAVPDGFVRDLVGMPVSDAKRQLQQHGLTALVFGVWFGPDSWILITQGNGVSLRVFLGRVVRAERPAKTWTA